MLAAFRFTRGAHSIYPSVAAATLPKGVGDNERWKVESRWKGGGKRTKGGKKEGGMEKRKGATERKKRVDLFFDQFYHS